MSQRSIENVNSLIISRTGVPDMETGKMTSAVGVLLTKHDIHSKENNLFTAVGNIPSPTYMLPL